MRAPRFPTRGEGTLWRWPSQLQHGVCVPRYPCPAFKRGPQQSQHCDLSAVEIDGCAVHPGRARRHQEGNEIGHIVNLAVADDAGFTHKPRPHLILAVAAALHLGLDAPPLSIGLDEAWMDAVDLHA